MLDINKLVESLASPVISAALVLIVTTIIKRAIDRKDEREKRQDYRLKQHHDRLQRIEARLGLRKRYNAEEDD